MDRDLAADNQCSAISYSNTSDRNLNTIHIKRPDPHHRNIATGVTVLDRLKLARKPNNHVASLGGRQDLRRAPSKATAEGHEIPEGPEPLPPLGLELVGVIAPGRCIPEHDDLVDLDHVAFSHVDGGSPVCAAAEREAVVLERYAHLAGGNRVQSLCCEGVAVWLVL